MIVSAHQPAYNPWLGYFHKLLLSDVFVIMDDVQFEKNSFINRNKIFQNPEGLMLTIPCDMKNYADKSIKEIEIFNDMWKKKHLRSLSQTYSKSPYFDKVFPIVEKALSLESKLLIDYSNQLFMDIVSYLEIDTKIVFASDLDIKSKKLDYVIELTKKLNGNVFIFGKLGQDYADVNYLNDNQITSIFQDYQHPEYKQKGENFIPYLGIIDLIMNIDSENAIKVILSRNINKKNIK